APEQSADAAQQDRATAGSSGRSDESAWGDRRGSLPSPSMSRATDDMDDAAAPGGSADPATPDLRGGLGRGEPVFASYQPAVQWLTDRVNYERIRPNRVDPKVFKLDRMRVLLAELGDPHRAFRSVHVAGSKGKGSVVEMAASMLGACGYTTGVYTS